MDLNDWLWFGFFSFAAGSVILFLMGRGRRTREEENHWLIHLFVTLTAMCSYFAMATGDGRFTLESGRDVFYARYIDWSITTPMLLLGLALSSLHTPFRRWAILLGLMWTDVFMILTGVAASFSPVGTSQKWIWFFISGGAQLFIYICIWTTLRKEAEKSGHEAAKVFKKNATFLSIIWFFYPVNFALGSEGLQTYGVETSVAIYAIMDVIAKVVYGIFSFSNTKTKTTRELARREVPLHELRPTDAMHHEVKAVGRNELDHRYYGDAEPRHHHPMLHHDRVAEVPRTTETRPRG